MTGNLKTKEPSKFLIIAAFAGLYIIWGSTYIAILYAIRSIPPFILVATRFITAGSLLYAWCIYRGEPTPSFKNILTMSVGGILMLFVGNSAVTWSEQHLPSGLAAIIVATVPIWFIVLDKKQWHYHFSNRRIIAGVFLGFAGVFMLFAGKSALSLTSSTVKIVSFAVLITGTIGWAIGSLYSKYKQVDGSVTMKAAVQMMSAGVVALAVALISGEQKQFIVSDISFESVVALVYLITMGSLVGYMSYIWLLSVRPASLVGTYAYVNPVVAVFLGWLLLSEAITMAQVVALLVILTGVILTNWKRNSK